LRGELENVTWGLLYLIDIFKLHEQTILKNRIKKLNK